jgi:hypothetical protein
MGELLTCATLAWENDCFAETRGVSQNCSDRHFIPAFKDRLTGETHASVFEDGRPAMIHLLDGLPEHWIVSRDKDRHVTAVLETIISGFLRNGVFFTREEVVAENQGA